MRVPRFSAADTALWATLAILFMLAAFLLFEVALHEYRDCHAPHGRNAAVDRIEAMERGQ